MSTVAVSPALPTVAQPPRTVEAYQVPSLGYRIVVATLRLIPLVLALLVLPVAALTYLQSRSIEVPVSISTVAFYGIAMCAMNTARYIAKPSRAYGPVSMVSAGVTAAFLVTLLLQATYQFGVPQTSVTVSVTYIHLVELLLVVPAFSLLAGLVTTVEDFRSPTERLPFDFPP